MSKSKLIATGVGIVFAGIAGLAIYLIIVSSNLPKLITVEDYEPLLVSEVYDRGGNKIGEFFREKRQLVPYPEIPKIVTQAFISSEDASFFEHGGINFTAILRAMIANIKAGRKVQGGSTITQQVARSLLLSREKTYIRKIKEVILAYRMEDNLSKEDIMFLYLNQIYLGLGAYGIGTASQIYFQKPIQDITLPEAALLAGLPQAPSRYSPISNPIAAKNRQKYVLRRMAAEGYITEESAEEAIKQPVKVYLRKNYRDIAPFYLETIRQVLVEKLGESVVLDEGIKIYTGLDMKKQQEAQKQVRSGLRDLDKRQGFRGAEKNLTDPQQVAEFLLKVRNDLIDEKNPIRIIREDGTHEERGPLNLKGVDDEGNPLPNIPSYIDMDQVVKGIVTKVDDKWGLVHVRFAEARGLIDIERMSWARKPDPAIRWEQAKIEKPSEALKKGDVIEIRVVGKTFRSERLDKDLRKIRKRMKKNYKRPDELPEFDQFAEVELEQVPSAEGALLSIDQRTGDIIAMVGGYDFGRSQFNRTYQAARQTGSSFKAFVYASALDKGFSPATPIIDAPVVFEEEKTEEGQDSPEIKRWKPMNHSHSFRGDILFRNALKLSLNVPTVKIIEKVGIGWVADYARRLGIFSPLNMDLTLALGSSGVTVYEMTKAFAHIGRLGRKFRPHLIHKVENAENEEILKDVSLDDRFEEEIATIEETFEKRRQRYLAQKRNPQAEPSTGDPTNKPENQPAGPSTLDLQAGGSNDGSATTADAAPADPRKEPPIFFKDENQLIKKETAYVTLSLLRATVEERRGTGGRARGLGRPVAAKTGSTSGYYDAWFVGFTPDIATGVWVGYDEEKSLGKGEVGGRSALPIWLEYMKFAHAGLPVRNFTPPEGIVFANIDNETGKLASASSDEVVRQAFAEGTEPQQVSSEMSSQEEERDFYKEDLSE